MTEFAWKIICFWASAFWNKIGYSAVDSKSFFFVVVSTFSTFLRAVFVDVSARQIIEKKIEIHE